ncbi:hypothetical protein FB446DRAFT_730996 [Lentinula raphanica]|nr:hypothetical protein FB446DRAFT_730996 [Lentinula raphanica]
METRATDRDYSPAVAHSHSNYRMHKRSFLAVGRGLGTLHWSPAQWRNLEEAVIIAPILAKYLMRYILLVPRYYRMTPGVHLQHRFQVPFLFFISVLVDGGLLVSCLCCRRCRSISVANSFRMHTIRGQVDTVVVARGEEFNFKEYAHYILYDDTRTQLTPTLKAYETMLSHTSEIMSILFRLTIFSMLIRFVVIELLRQWFEHEHSASRVYL